MKNSGDPKTDSLKTKIICNPEFLEVGFWMVKSLAILYKKKNYAFHKIVSAK